MSLKGFIFSFLWIASLLSIGSVFRFLMFDELLCIFVLFCALKQGFWRSRKLVILIIYVLLHLVISVIYGYNGNKAILLDALMYAKPFVCALACGSGYFVLKSKDNNVLNVMIFFLLSIFFLDSIAAWMIGARNVASRPPFWFTTNCTLAGTTSLMMLFYMFTSKGLDKTIPQKYYMYAILIMTVLVTMQGKYFGFAFSFFLLKFFSEKILPSLQSERSVKRISYKFISLLMLLFGICGVLFLALDDLNAYYLTDNQDVARVMMVRSLPKVLDGVYFFTGRGFGAFCSPVTSVYYPAGFMKEIGLSGVYGLSQSYSNLMSDGYLWSFAGCFGLIGVFLYAAFIIYMFNPFVKLWKNRILPAKLGFACLVCFSWVVIFSFGSGLMFGYGCFVMLLWGMLRWQAVQILKQETATA